MEVAGLPCPPMKSKPPPPQLRADQEALAGGNRFLFTDPVTNLDWDGFTRVDTEGIPEVWLKDGTEVRCRDKTALWFMIRVGPPAYTHIVDPDPLERVDPDSPPPMLRRSIALSALL